MLKVLRGDFLVSAWRLPPAQLRGPKNSHSPGRQDEQHSTCHHTLSIIAILRSEQRGLLLCPSRRLPPLDAGRRRWRGQISQKVRGRKRLSLSVK